MPGKAPRSQAGIEPLWTLEREGRHECSALLCQKPPADIVACSGEFRQRQCRLDTVSCVAWAV